MITDRKIDQVFSDLRATCGGVREDYFGLLYLEQEHNVPREKAVNQIAFGGNDYQYDAQETVPFYSLRAQGANFRGEERKVLTTRNDGRIRFWFNEGKWGAD